MFDMRAYVTSLVAVFLALGIGILLGTIIVDKGTVTRQQSALLKSIEEQVTNVAEDNKLLKKELEQSAQFQKDVLPHVIQGRLKGKNIAIVYSGNINGDLIKDLKSVIESASANVQTIEIKNEAFLNTSANIGKIKRLLTTQAISKNMDENKLIPYSLASALSLPTSSLSLPVLKEQGFVDFSGSKNTMFSAVLVLLDPDKATLVLDKFYKPMVDSLKDFAVPVVAAEAAIGDEKAVHKLGDEKIMTIDNIDKVPGQISMVYGLAGKTGSFGAGAKSLVPGIDSVSDDTN